MNPNKKQMCLYLDRQVADDLEDIAKMVGRQRGRFCPKSEIAEVAIMAFVASFNANVEKQESENN